MKSLLQACKHLHPCVNSVWKQWGHQQLPQIRYHVIYHESLCSQLVPIKSCML